MRELQTRRPRARSLQIAVSAKVSKDGQPGDDVGSVVFGDIGSERTVCAEERGAQIGDQFFEGVTFVSEALPAEVAFYARTATVEP